MQPMCITKPVCSGYLNSQQLFITKKRINKLRWPTWDYSLDVIHKLQVSLPTITEISKMDTIKTTNIFESVSMDLVPFLFESRVKAETEELYYPLRMACRTVLLPL